MAHYRIIIGSNYWANIFTPYAHRKIINNPFNCDCNLIWLKIWLAAVSLRNIAVYHEKQIQCAKPNLLAGRSLLGIASNNMRCGKSEKWLEIIFIYSIFFLRRGEVYCSMLLSNISLITILLNNFHFGHCIHRDV